MGHFCFLTFSCKFGGEIIWEEIFYWYPPHGISIYLLSIQTLKLSKKFFFPFLLKSINPNKTVEKKKSFEEK